MARFSLSAMLVALVLVGCSGPFWNPGPRAGGVYQPYQPYRPLAVPMQAYPEPAPLGYPTTQCSWCSGNIPTYQGGGVIYTPPSQPDNIGDGNPWNNRYSDGQFHYPVTPPAPRPLDQIDLGAPY